MQYLSVTQALNPFVDFSNVPAERLSYSAERGRIIHSACAAYAQNLFVPPMPEDHQLYFQSFQSWFDQYVKQVIWVEQELSDNKYFFHGHPDILCILISGEKVIVDYKTPVSESPTWRAQISAYCFLAQVSKGMVLNLSPQGKAARAIVYTQQKSDFAAFLAALTATRYFKI